MLDDFHRAFFNDRALTAILKSLDLSLLAFGNGKVITASDNALRISSA